MIVVYLIKEKSYVPCLEKFPIWVSHIGFLLLPLLLTLISIWMKRWLSKDDINHDPLGVEEANSSFLLSYLGYFFVALSVNSTETMIFVYFLIVFVFYIFLRPCITILYSYCLDISFIILRLQIILSYSL